MGGQEVRNPAEGLLTTLEAYFRDWSCLNVPHIGALKKASASRWDREEDRKGR